MTLVLNLKAYLEGFLNNPNGRFTASDMHRLCNDFRRTSRFSQNVSDLVLVLPVDAAIDSESLLSNSSLHTCLYSRYSTSYLARIGVTKPRILRSLLRQDLLFRIFPVDKTRPTPIRIREEISPRRQTQLWSGYHGDQYSLHQRHGRLPELLLPEAGVYSKLRSPR